MMLMICFDASFNSHQHVLLSGRPVSHGQLLLSQNMHTFVKAKSEGKGLKFGSTSKERKEKMLNSVSM